MIYEYQNTIITVRPGLGGDNYATCKNVVNQWKTLLLSGAGIIVISVAGN